MQPGQLVSVIMPSYLFHLDGTASDKQRKFRRAVDSFLSQTREQKELVIISDGCIITERLYRDHYSKYPNIKFQFILKQDLFSGTVRDEGLKIATGDILTYLDYDDYMQITHLDNVASGFLEDDPDWCYFNDWIKRENNDKSKLREVQLTKGEVGISSIAHKKDLNVSWKGCDGRGHEWLFVQRLIKASSHRRKIGLCSYIICHVTGEVDL